MISIYALMTSGLLISSFEYEIDRGLMLEIKAGGTITDSSDNGALAGGARLSYSLANKKDFYLTSEFDFSYQSFKYELAGQSDKYKTKQIAELNLVVYELFNPYAIRAAVGGGTERRLSKFSPLVDYRVGLGYYLSPDWGIYGDSLGRYIFRQGKDSVALELDLSVQYIF